MSDLLPYLRDLLLAQRACSEMVTIPADLMTKAEKHLEVLKIRYQVTGDEYTMLEHEALAAVLDDITEHRAELIWNMAYTQADPVKAMTPMERSAYSVLVDMAAKLRGIA